VADLVKLIKIDGSGIVGSNRAAPETLFYLTSRPIFG
jgi:hypothetical protein